VIFRFLFRLKKKEKEVTEKNHSSRGPAWENLPQELCISKRVKVGFLNVQESVLKSSEV